jgi:hypothetical protein
MEQALQTKESFDLYGLHFDSETRRFSARDREPSRPQGRIAP